MALIECGHLTKTFATGKTNARVVDDFSLSVTENEFVVLVGPGRCGKTTLINLMAGLETPSSGTVLLDGAPVSEPGYERGVVYQTTMLFPWLTVMGNVSYGLRMRHTPKAEWRAQAQKYIDLVGLTGFEASYPRQLSGGMKQRVGIARVYCNNPKVIFMDEPFGHLDAQTRYQMQQDVERICDRERKTVVFVTNNIEEAVYLADRVVVLSNCPARVRHAFSVSLPRPRRRSSPEFLALRQEIDAVIDRTE